MDSDENKPSYHVSYSKLASKQLDKLDGSVRSRILSWINKNLEGTKQPRLKGGALQANLNDKWKYRIGDYRILAKIDDDEIIILVLEVGHRREIYHKD